MLRESLSARLGPLVRAERHGGDSRSPVDAEDETDAREIVGGMIECPRGQCSRRSKRKGRRKSECYEHGEDQPCFQPGAILLAALSLSIGWGIRGNYGYEFGAMLPGALAAMAVCLISGREDWHHCLDLLVAPGYNG